MSIHELDLTPPSDAVTVPVQVTLTQTVTLNVTILETDEDPYLLIIDPYGLYHDAVVETAVEKAVESPWLFEAEVSPTNYPTDSPEA